jgi:hypothetical protein
VKTDPYRAGTRRPFRVAAEGNVRGPVIGINIAEM